MGRLAGLAIFALMAAEGAAVTAPLRIFACEPEWAALATELTGPGTEVTVATTAFQDPHRLQAKPSLIASARQADLLICSGAELEVGWLPLLVRRAGNPNIRPGTPGYFMAADHVRKLEIPIQVDRSQGDVHPQGNPHVHLNPNNISRIARQLTSRLTQLNPQSRELYAANLEAFTTRWGEAVATWEERMEPLAGMRLVPHHRSFSYLADWLDLDMVATVEAKPGIPPSGTHLASLLERLSADPPVAVIRTPYANEKPTTWLAERLDVAHITLPYTIGGADGAADLFSLFEVTITMLEDLAQ